MSQARSWVQFSQWAPPGCSAVPVAAEQAQVRHREPFLRKSNTRTRGKCEIDSDKSASTRRPGASVRAEITVQSPPPLGDIGLRAYGARNLSVYRHFHNAARNHKPVRGSAGLSQIVGGKDVATHRRVAWKSCVYALLLSLFFLIFGTLILRLFGVPLRMVRIVGGIILMKIGFELFSPTSSGGGMMPPVQRKTRISPLCRSRCRLCVVPVRSQQSWE